MRALLLILVCGISSGHAEQPPQGAVVVQEKTSGGDTKANTAQSQPQPAQSPVTAQPIPKNATPENTNKDSEKPPSGDARAVAEFKSFVATYNNFWVALLMAVIAGVQALFFWRQLKRMRESNATANKMAQVALNQSETSMTTERAYVRIGHKLPGVEHAHVNNYFQVNFEIKNRGRTPANVTDVMTNACRLDYGVGLPSPFVYRQETRESFPNAFLVTDEAFELTRSFPAGNKANGPIPNDKQLWVYGHVDYIDVFGKRWRSGYARKFIDRIGENLVYNTEQQDNFDRERMPGDGIDWTPEAVAKFNESKSPPPKRWYWQWPLIKR